MSFSTRGYFGRSVGIFTIWDYIDPRNGEYIIRGPQMGYVGEIIRLYLIVREGGGV